MDSLLLIILKNFLKKKSQENFVCLNEKYVQKIICVNEKKEERRIEKWSSKQYHLLQHYQNEEKKCTKFEFLSLSTISQKNHHTHLENM